MTSINEIAIKETLSEKERYMKRLDEIYARLKEKSFTDKDPSFRYAVKSLGQLFTMMIDCEQYDLNIQEPILADKVVKLTRMIPDHIIQIYGVNRVMYGGMFAVMPMWLLPANMIHACWKKSYRGSSIQRPEEFGLPPESQVNYGALKSVTSEVYIAPPKRVSRFMDEFINRVGHFNYVFMDKENFE